MTSSPRPRLPFLDVLRAIAILLVLGRHLEFNVPATDWSSPFFLALRLGSRIGWIGVDLFFVLSGFLVSGLLMREYLRFGSVDIKRFLLRRAARIYPAYYFFLAVMMLLRDAQGRPLSGTEAFAQVALVQNYLPNAFDHTWSLAVEEHFYLLLALFMAASVRLAPARAFRALPATFSVVALAMLALRIWTVRSVTPFAYETHLFPTHLRMDSLLFGVLLAYVYHFHHDAFRRTFQGRYRRALACASLLMITPAAFLPLEQSAFMQTLGLTLLYIGFGGILATGIHLQARDSGVLALAARLLAYVGVYSYSIYLWHVEIEVWVSKAYTQATGALPGPIPLFLLYVPASLGAGIALSKLIEWPVLRLRDRLLPARATATVPVA